MTWLHDSLPEIMVHLAGRPGHEAVRAAITDILRYGFHAKLCALAGKHDLSVAWMVRQPVHNLSQHQP